MYFRVYTEFSAHTTYIYLEKLRRKNGKVYPPADPKSERELRVLCTKLLRDEKRDEVEAEEAIKTLAHATGKKQPDSKKQ